MKWLNIGWSIMISEERPWGKYEVLLDEPYCKVKRITVEPNGKLSLQYHNKRQEDWVIVSGVGTVTLDDEVLTLTYGQNIRIPTGSTHRIENKGTDKLVFIETQTGEYFGEDDIIRLEDKYDRI